MRTISEMYEQSGGTAYQHECRECDHCKIPEERKKVTCLLHPQQPEWNPLYVACKWFNKDAEPRQISLFDMLGVM